MRSLALPLGSVQPVPAIFATGEIAQCVRPEGLPDVTLANRDSPAAPGTNCLIGIHSSWMNLLTYQDLPSLRTHSLAVSGTIPPTVTVDFTR